MSGSEHDFSESSSNLSPQSQLESPYSSPSQQVPHLVNVFSGITCIDDSIKHANEKRPYLRIVEQPQEYFRFRYKSEMVGTHGCILGRSSTANKNRTHPTIELHNYTGKAVIRVKLVQESVPDEHPHQLLEDEQEDRDVTTVVPQQGSYRVGFAGMGIIHTARKKVAAELFKKLIQDKSRNVSPRELEAHCHKISRDIEMNIVRLKFSAHDSLTDKEICPPVYSDKINNQKSAATNDLKICRISRYSGKPKGGDDVFIFVEKVNKKNILIRFYEVDEDGEVVWSANANFLQSDVHHQYGIVFRTPQYRYLDISKDVKVLVELVRPSDGRTSEPKEYLYKANVLTTKTNKRPRVDSTLSSMDSSSGESIKSLVEVPTTVEQINEKDGVNVAHVHIPVVPTSSIAAPSTSTSNMLAEALSMTAGGGFQPTPQSGMFTQPSSILSQESGMLPPSSGMLTPSSGMLGQTSMFAQSAHNVQTNMSEPPVISLNSAELERLINQDQQLPSEEKKKFIEMDWSEYMQSFGIASLPDKSYNSMDFLRTSMNLVADSRKAKKEPNVKVKTERPSNVEVITESQSNEEVKTERQSNVEVITEIQSTVEVKTESQPTVEVKTERQSPVREVRGTNIADRAKNNDGYNAYYKAEHGNEVKKLVKEICEIFKNKTGHKRQVVRDKLERLFEMRLSNGDTFLHMALNSNQPSLEYMIKMIHSLKMTHLLNLTNDQQQTILHSAIINDMPKLVQFLVSKGCDPMIADVEGNNAIHYAVICQSCLKPLLDAIEQSGQSYTIDACNNEGQSALHLAALYDCVSAALLLSKHASLRQRRDLAARTPAHLAALDKHLQPLIAILLNTTKMEIDEVDGSGNTVLQILCDQPDVTNEKLDIIKMLLEKGADPHKREYNNISAWSMSRDKPRLKQFLKFCATQPALQHINIVKTELDSGDEQEAHDTSVSKNPDAELNRKP